MSLLRCFFAVCTLLVALLAGCGTQGRCTDNGQCPDLHACIRSGPDKPGSCLAVECLTNEHCDLGEYCSDQGWICQTGCTSNLDCRAGEACDVNTNSCQAYGCRDTQLDCGYGQFCDTNTGQCYDASGHCEPGCDDDLDCNGGYCLGTDPTGITCSGFPGECGSGAGCYCANPPNCTQGECLGQRCFAACTTDTDCPRGFACYNEPTIGSFCFADCAYIEQWQ